MSLLSKYILIRKDSMSHIKHRSSSDDNMTPTPRRRENPTFSREIELIDSYVWVPSTTLLCSIFLPVLVKAIPCIGKDLGMSTIEYASLMVELQHDAYTSKTRESHIFEGNRARESLISRETKPREMSFDLISV